MACCWLRQSVHGHSCVGQNFPLGRGMVPVVEQDGVSTFNSQESRS